MSAAFMLIVVLLGCVSTHLLRVSAMNLSLILYAYTRQITSLFLKTSINGLFLTDFKAGEGFVSNDFYLYYYIHQNHVILYSFIRYENTTYITINYTITTQAILYLSKYLCVQVQKINKINNSVIILRTQ